MKLTSSKQRRALLVMPLCCTGYAFRGPMRQLDRPSKLQQHQKDVEGWNPGQLTIWLREGVRHAKGRCRRRLAGVRELGAAAPLVSPLGLVSHRRGRGRARCCQA